MAKRKTHFKCIVEARNPYLITTTFSPLALLVGNCAQAQTRIEMLTHFDLGLLTSLCTNPIWVIKTRMLSTSSKYPGAYTSILDGSRQIFRSEGLSGFYRGLIPSLVGVSHGAVFFAVYEPLKSWRATMNHGANASTLDTLIITTVGKIIAASATYPYQVVRARLQTYNAGAEYRGVRDTLEQIRQAEGIKGFYKGMGPGLVRVLPSVWVTFLVAEKLKLAMSGARSGGS